MCDMDYPYNHAIIDPVRLDRLAAVAVNVGPRGWSRARTW
jgi:hypothetical protein